MNERIDELFGQALDQAVPETWTTLNPAQLSKLKDKFAELIVRECIEQCVHTNHNNQWDKGIAWAVGQIKQHFGVE